MLFSALPVLAWLAASASLAQPPAGDVRQLLDTAVETAMTSDRLPSLSFAVALNGELVHRRAFGFADLENAVPATERSVYPLGSLSKPVTALVALRLAAGGKLDLDAPVREYCPAYPQKDHPVTTRQLLGHLGGVRHYDYRRFDEDFLNRRPFASTEEALTKFSDDPLVSAPGTTYLYSSWGYVLAGCALEGASGEDYGRLVADWVFEPARMETATLFHAQELIPHRVRGYYHNDAGEWHPDGGFDVSDRYASGGLGGTPTDLVRLALALLAADAPDGLLSARDRDALWTSQRDATGEGTGYGLGWNVGRTEDGVVEVFHGGSTLGSTAYLYLRPDEGTVVAFVTNLSRWQRDRHALARQLADLVAGTPPAP